jgi:hypothetical protein
MKTISHSRIGEVLESAAELLAQPDRWTQYAFARDQFGNEVSPRDQRAVAFDIVGAIKHVSPSFDAAERIIEMMPYVDGKSPSEWNDQVGRTQAEVVAKLTEIALNNQCLVAILQRIASRAEPIPARTTA